MGRCKWIGREGERGRDEQRKRSEEVEFVNKFRGKHEALLLTIICNIGYCAMIMRVPANSRGGVLSTLANRDPRHVCSVWALCMQFGARGDRRH